MIELVLQLFFNLYITPGIRVLQFEYYWFRQTTVHEYLVRNIVYVTKYVLMSYGVSVINLARTKCLIARRIICMVSVFQVSQV
jgi:hypothetical protein